jgi:hypothetical protein
LDLLARPYQIREKSKHASRIFGGQFDEKVDTDYHQQAPEACAAMLVQQSVMIGGSAMEFGMVSLADLNIPITRRFQSIVPSALIAIMDDGRF